MNAWFLTRKGDAVRGVAFSAFRRPVHETGHRSNAVRGWRSRHLFGGRQPVQGGHQFSREEIEAAQPAFLIVPIV